MQLPDFSQLPDPPPDYLEEYDAPPPLSAAEEAQMWAEWNRINGNDADPDEPATPDISAGVVVPPPSDPIAVARVFAETVHTVDGTLRLRHYRGGFHAYRDGAWPEAEKDAVRSAVWRFLESAVFRKGDGFKPFEPTTRKVNDVLDALRAVTHLDGDVNAPSWLSGDGPFPADELVPVRNGLLHLPTRSLMAHSSDYFTPWALDYDWDPDAPEPDAWLRFLRDLWGDDDESIATLQEWMGYLLMADTSQQKMLLLYGPKRSGKGTIGRLIRGLLGSHSVAGPTLASLATNFGMQALIGKPLAIISDARLGSRVDSQIVLERLLSVSGEDALTVDRKYREPWTGRLPTRLMILTNELPRLQDSSGALTSRFVLLVLTKSFYGREDPTLERRLLAERAGILHWALDGLDRLRDRGHFIQPQTSRDTLSELEDLAAPIAAFVRDACVLGPDYEVPIEGLYGEYREWCQRQGLTYPPTIQIFGRDLRAAFPTVSGSNRRTPSGRRIRTYRGIALLAHPKDYEHATAALQGRLGNDEHHKPDPI